MQLAITTWKDLTAKYPGAEFRVGLGRAYTNLGWVFTCAGRMDMALEASKKAVDLHDKVVGENHADTSFKYRLAISLENLGLAYFFADEPVKAAKTFRRALAEAEPLVRQNPTVTEFLERVISDHIELGHALLLSGQDAEARRSFEKALELGKQLDPEVTSRYFSYASIHRGVGKLLRKQRQPEEARKSLREAVIIGGGKNPGGEKPYTTYELACANALCSALVGEGKAALTADEKQEKLRYADQAMAALHLAATEGWENHSWMEKDPDLHTLHCRADFRMLLQNLQERAKTKASRS